MTALLEPDRRHRIQTSRIAGLALEIPAPADTGGGAELLECTLTVGMVGGIGTALLEETRLDPRFGRVTNVNLAEYLVPVNADVEQLEDLFVDEHDPHIGPARCQGRGRDRDLRGRAGDRERGLPRHRAAGARPSDHPGKAAVG